MVCGLIEVDIRDRIRDLCAQIPQDELTSMEKTIAVKAHEQVQKVCPHSDH